MDDKVSEGITFPFEDVLVFNLLILLFLLQEKTKKKAFPLFVFWSRLLCFLAGYRVKPKHAYLVHEGPCIFIANHTSFLDIVFIGIVQCIIDSLLG